MSKLTLPGLKNGDKLGILAEGELEKRRDGAVRGGWAHRTFVLTRKALHYFRQTDPGDLLGEERGSVLLRDITSAKIVPSAEVSDHLSDVASFYLEINTRQRQRQIFLRSGTENEANEWVQAINTAIHIARHQKFRQDWTPAATQRFFRTVSGQDIDEEIESSALEFETPQVVLLTVTEPGKNSGAQRVVSRHLIKDEPHSVRLGRVQRGASCFIYLSNNTAAELSYAALRKFASTTQLCHVLATDDQGKERAINLSLKCSKVQTESQGELTSDDNEKSDISGLSLSPVFDPFPSSMKLTLFVGVVVAGIRLFRQSSDTKSGCTSQASGNSVLKTQTVEYFIELDDIIPSADDGSHVEVVSDDGFELEEVPKRFIDAEKGDEFLGRERWEKTMEWRQENEIDTILNRPHPNFQTIKRFYPQFFHGRSMNNNPVYYELPGRIDLPALREEGLSIDDLLQHFIYISEYLWQVLEPSDSARSISVVDISGIGMSDIGGEVLDFIKKASAVSGAHYPERSAHIYIINVPSWFSWTWNMIKTMIDPVTREKVHMVSSKNILKELSTHISLDQIPLDYGGTGPALGDSEEEARMAKHVAEYLDSTMTTCEVPVAIPTPAHAEDDQDDCEFMT